jgi:hypothetical protein
MAKGAADLHKKAALSRAAQERDGRKPPLNVQLCTIFALI